MLFSHVVYGTQGTHLGCTEEGLNDNLALLSIKGTPTEIFRLQNFANTIFSQSSNLGSLLAHFKGWESLSLLGVGCGCNRPF